MSLPKICTCPTVPAADCPFHHQGACRSLAAMPSSALDLARRFHETYERLAPQFGYETRIDTRAFDPASPNGKLMAAVCAEVAEPIREGLYDEMWRIMKQRDDLRKALEYIAHSGISGRHKEDVANEALSSQNADVLAPAGEKTN